MTITGTWMEKHNCQMYCQDSQDLLHQGVFCSSALRTLFCDLWSTTLTGDTMSGVARDVAAGAGKMKETTLYDMVRYVET